VPSAKPAALPVRLALQADQRLLADCAEGSLLPLDRGHLEPTDCERAARLHHLSHRDESLSRSGRQQVDLEFDRKHRAARGKQGIAGIAAGGIGDRARDAGVQVAVLLGEIGLVGQGDFRPSGLDPHELGADGSHQRLAGKALPDLVLEGGVLGLEPNHGIPGATILHCQRLAHAGPERAFSAMARRSEAVCDNPAHPRICRNIVFSQ